MSEILTPGDAIRWEAACGDYEDEKAGLLDLDLRIQATGLFNIASEARGTLLQPLPNSEPKEMRIDRILFPTTKLIGRGWRHGYIGVEAKKPGEKMGPALAQAMDYLRTAFISPNTGARIMVNWLVLWPFEFPSGPTESVMAQNRVATCTPRVKGLHFKTSGETLLYHSPYNDETRIRKLDTVRKNGAR